MRFFSLFTLSFEGWSATSEMNALTGDERFARMYGSAASTDDGSKRSSVKVDNPFKTLYGLDRDTMRALNRRDARWSVDAGDVPNSKVILVPKSYGSVESSTDEPYDPVSACEDKLAKIKQRLRCSKRVEAASTARGEVTSSASHSSHTNSTDESIKTDSETMQKDNITNSTREAQSTHTIEHKPAIAAVEPPTVIVNKRADQISNDLGMQNNHNSNLELTETRKREVDCFTHESVRSTDRELTSDTCTSDVRLETLHSSSFEDEDYCADFERCLNKRKKRRHKKNKPKKLNNENCSSRANSKNSSNIQNCESEKQKKKTKKRNNKHKNNDRVKNETDIQNSIVQNEINDMKCNKTSAKKVDKQTHNSNADGPIYFCPETSKLFKTKKHNRKMKRFYNNSWVNSLCGKYLSFLKRPDSEKSESDVNTSNTESHQNTAFDEITGKFQKLSSSDCDSASEDAFTIVFKNDDTQGDTEPDQLKSRMRIGSECESEDSFMIYFDSDCEAPVCDNVFTNDDIFNDNSWTSDEDEVDGYSCTSDLSEDEPTLVTPALKGCLKKQKSRGTSPESEHSQKNVSFDETPVVVHTIMEWEAEYQQSRIGPWEGYARDAERFKQRVMDLSLSLDWIFKREHRNRIYFQRFRPILIRQIREEKKAKEREAERLKKEQENKTNNNSGSEETFVDSGMANNSITQGTNSESQSVNSELITVS